MTPHYRAGDVPACTCTAGDHMEFPAQHATLCPRFNYPRILRPGGEQG